ncbi:hypothetical protein FTT06_026110, partial [Escherichia coli]|nr:hypothetical protein [Escherichia coli]
MPPVLWRGWIPFCRCTEGKKVRNKQVVLLIAGISGIATGIIVSLNIPFIHQGLFYPASPVEIVVSLCLTFCKRKLTAVCSHQTRIGNL